MLAVAKMSSTRAVPICIPASGVPVPVANTGCCQSGNVFANFLGRKGLFIVVCLCSVTSKNEHFLHLLGHLTSVFC